MTETLVSKREREREREREMFDIIVNIESSFVFLFREDCKNGWTEIS